MKLLLNNFFGVLFLVLCGALCVLIGGGAGVYLCKPLVKPQQPDSCQHRSVMINGKLVEYYVCPSELPLAR